MPIQLVHEGLCTENLMMNYSQYPESEGTIKTMINSLRHTTQYVIGLLIMLVDFLRVFITVYTLKQNVCKVKMVTYCCLLPILIICESMIKQEGS